MRLYFKTGACSLSVRIALNELGISHDSVQVNTATGLTEVGENYQSINPKGYVPALKLDNGNVITENPAVLQYLADLKPAAGLAPANGTIERVHLQEWLNFIASELHKSFSPYFSGRDLEPGEKERVEANLFRRISDIERVLSDNRSFILGDAFTVADAYLFVVLNWTNFIGIDLARWPHAAAYMKNIAVRPSVHQALMFEGLIKKDAA